ncbi:hypothetical protein HJFPF1_05243 [Paramyrothecium foliicola]|nr:hypothetical protein HJFPF1_05243 [Paramyrothecium foliicola]
MEQLSKLVLDPNGDVEIVLTSPNTQIFEWVGSEGVDVKTAAAGNMGDDSGAPSSPNLERPTELRLLASSKHLCLASPVFRKMLTWPHRESNEKKAVHEIRATGWHAREFIMVLDAIHGRHSLIPHGVTSRSIARIGAIADFYDCHESIECFVNSWIDARSSCHPSQYGEECMLWMLISWVFLRPTICGEMAGVAMAGCPEELQTMDLPLPLSLIQLIKDGRAKRISTILKTVNNLHKTLVEEPDEKDLFDTELRVYEYLKPAQGTFVPEVCGQVIYNTKRALLLKDVGGIPLASPEGAILELDKLSELLQECFRSLHSLGVHQLDPNPGDYHLVDGKLVAFDFGDVDFDPSEDDKQYFMTTRISTILKYYRQLQVIYEHDVHHVSRSNLRHRV